MYSPLSSETIYCPPFEVLSEERSQYDMQHSVYQNK